MHNPHRVLVVDTETANTIQDGDKLDMSNVLVYDCGWQVVDTSGTVYAERSFVNHDIFEGEKELMQKAFYADKIPQYLEDLKAGRRIMSDTYSIRKAMLDDMSRYGIMQVAAHNARFDLTALNVTQRHVTKSRFRFWFPYGTEIWDTMKMANQVICKTPEYKEFCKTYGYLTKTGQVRRTAEILWRFISKDLDFVESHTGLEDVQIEAKIMTYCFKQSQHLDAALFPKKKIVLPTDFQQKLSQSLKERPVIRRAA